MIEINNYAPIIIPTLNRYEHFKNCVESLSNNIGADKTTLYVGLDFPAKESHKEGYLKIKKYLSSHNLKFKEVYVYEREYNYGVFANGNLEKLLIEVCKKYDRYIVSEDDNIFSPYFLQYINWGLTEYENDPTVTAICGYNLPIKGEIQKTDANLFRNYSHFSAWGFGTWFKKTNELSIVNSKWAKWILKNMDIKIKELTGSPSDVLPVLVNLFQHDNRKAIWKTDKVLTTYNSVYDKCTISPIYSKVKNCGWDGTGNSMESEVNEVMNFAYHFTDQNIDNSADSVYVVASEEYSRHYSQQISNSFICNPKVRAKAEKKLNIIMKI